MVRDAYYFLAPTGLLLGVALWNGVLWLALVLLGTAGFLAFFFRDPDRSPPDDSESVLSPADGRVIRVHPHEDGYILSVFLSIFDVHVIRAPIAGRIVEQQYRPGRFRIAYDNRASVENEQVKLTISGSKELTFSLIAGIVARRIRVWAEEGAPLNRGDRIGLIRFGSRVDVHLPADCELRVAEGDRVWAGRSVLAGWRGNP